MQNRWRLGRGLATLMAATLFSVPQLAFARQGCENRGGDGNSYRRAQNNRYRDSSANYSGYRDRGYQYNDYGRNRYANNDYSNGGYYGDYRPERSAGQSAAIIGGSAAAGAVIGGLSGGTKGAIIGAAVGGVGGLVYDRATRDRQNGW